MTASSVPGSETVMRFLERRFPLRFTTENPILRELYGQAKGLRWNPETDIAWSRFDPEVYPPAVREAARLVWSRRAWGTYPGLGENTALLIRFCLESGAAGMDAKLPRVLVPSFDREREYVRVVAVPDELV